MQIVGYSVAQSLLIIGVFCGVGVRCLSQSQLIWEGEKAVGLEIVNPLASPDEYELTLVASTRPILGRWSKVEEKVVFRSAVPLTPSYRYLLKENNEVIDTLVAGVSRGRTPKLLSVYPRCDTVPENLLKVHLVFDQAMGELHSQQFITVTNSLGDSLDRFFLDLNPELWSEDQTSLTLWLDPGRIKRGLGPNQAYGMPMQQGRRYQIQIAPSWRAKNGRSLNAGFSKIYYAGAADRTKPDPARWTLDVPARNTTHPLHLCFLEHLDLPLLQECISIYRKRKTVAGKIIVDTEANAGSFYPTSLWEPGTYEIRVEVRLEDLAGNNLTRLFDQPIPKEDNTTVAQDFVEIPFQIN